uniref:Uncharacterized protein n=1 Tax=Zooxanthella nutricula TaxID=1333877 RepID=A0A6U6NWU9_9DINO
MAADEDAKLPHQPQPQNEEEEQVTLPALHEKCKRLKLSTDRIKDAIQKRATSQLDELEERTENQKEFILEASSTIAGWITAATVVTYIAMGTGSLFEGSGSEEHVGAGHGGDQMDHDAGGEDFRAKFVANCIYVSLLFVFVPVCGWFLRKPWGSRGLVRNTVTLIRFLLPKLFEWGGEGLFDNLTRGFRLDSLHKLAVAVSLTAVVFLLTVAPWYLKSKRAVITGDGDTILARMALVPGYFCLSAGMTWNAVIRDHVENLETASTTPLLRFMIECAAFLIITGVSLLIAWKLRTRAEELEASLTSDTPEVFSFNTVVLAGSMVLLNSVYFINAFAQLDMLYAFFYGYMLGCRNAEACSYQSHFAFALVFTYFACRAGFFLMRDKPDSSFTRAWYALTLEGLRLDVGLVWMHFLESAVESEVELEQDTVHLAEPVVYTIITVFLIVVVVVVNHRLHQVVDHSLADYATAVGARWSATEEKTCVLSVENDVPVEKDVPA